MEIYSHPRHCGPATPDQLESILESLTEIAKERSCRRPSLRLPKIGDLAGCSACQGIFLEPVTVSCGHTFCRKCLIKENVLITCNVCGATNTFNHISNLKINVTISTLVEKWWSNALQSAKLRFDGNELFLIGKVDLALEKYTRAYELGEKWKKHLHQVQFQLLSKFYSPGSKCHLKFLWFHKSDEECVGLEQIISTECSIERYNRMSDVSWN